MIKREACNVKFRLYKKGKNEFSVKEEYICFADYVGAFFTAEELYDLLLCEYRAKLNEYEIAEICKTIWENRESENVIKVGV